ncbi:hypothetical protein GIB67_037769 [Kingdonia uniflora]|uniref:SWIM-type domain-containing protein n=1 Tax=Kingdonia uniflora TaxID=39325 RepID=A0A7J7LV66_9MAGN|nr:hypothetical protein GIB67_037769 [Kingdonia uniflora]
MMKLTYDRRVKAQGWDQNFVVPRAKIHIDRIKRFYNEYEPQGSNFNSWVVICKDGKKWKVNLEERNCDCNEWQVTGLPCVHAYCVISHMRLNWVGYCSKYHMVSSYVKTYSGSALTISDPSLWDKTVNIEVLPPPLVRGPTYKGPPAELRPRGLQPAIRVTGGGRSRGNRPRDSIRTRSRVTTELPIQPTVPTPRGRGRRGTNVRGRSNSQTGRSGSGITKDGRGRTAVARGRRGSTAVVRGERGITEAGKGKTVVARGGKGSTQARRCNIAAVRGRKDNTQARRGGRGTASLSQEPIIPTQGSQTSKEPPNNPYKKLFRPLIEIWLI